MTTPPPDKAPKPGLNIYGCLALNPYKLTIAAEELGVPYTYMNIDVLDGKAEWFTAINPNGRFPAIVHVKEDGSQVSVWESGACLEYIVSEFDKTNKLTYQSGSPEYWQQKSWLAWQISGYGPMMGQACHFNRYAVADVPYGKWRYTAEARRLHHVLDKQLSKTPFVAGDRLTIADVAIYVYTSTSKWCGVDLDLSPHIKAWHEKLSRRPAFQKGMSTPIPFKFSNEAVSNPDAQDFYKEIRKFGSQGIKMATDSWPGEIVPLLSDHANLQD